MLIRVDEAPQGWNYLAVDYEPSESRTDLNRWVQGEASGVDPVDLTGSLVDLGDEGWELVSVVPFTVRGKTKFKAIFKRAQFVTGPVPEMKQYTMPISSLKRDLALYPDDCEVTFGNGNLAFYRTKLRGDKLVQIEFNQMTDMVPDEP